MAVYKRTYRGYAGSFTPDWSRFLVLFRYSRRSLFRSKVMNGFFLLCFFFPLLCLLGIYANDHISAFGALGQRGGGLLPKVDGSFFFFFLQVQTVLGFILTAFVGPGLISPDLANGALTLYLCRPLSRVEYVLGKFFVLAGILSWVTWIPGLILFFVQSSLSGWDWMITNSWIALGIFLGSWIWIVYISLLALALSAWVKWRIAAGALLLGVLFIGSAFAAAINTVLQTQQGYLLHVSRLIEIILQDLLHNPGDRALPAGEAWFGILAFCALCFYVLMKKIKANEVVR
jgi:ABC-2 type transport system permease protein